VGLERAAEAGSAIRLFPREAAVHLCRAAWGRAVGEELARRTEVLAVEGRTLRVKVPDSSWRKVLHPLEGEILTRMRGIIGAMAPTRIGFSEGFVASPPAPPKPLEDIPPGGEPSPLVSESALGIRDPELRRAFLETSVRYLERSRRHG
jgi:hypothetical protein